MANAISIHPAVDHGMWHCSDKKVAVAIGGSYGG